MKNLIIILLLLISVSVKADIFYVATDGSNSNPGTLAEPFLTVQYGINALSRGDTLYIRGGVYMLTARIEITGESGTADSLIVVSAYPSDHAADSYPIIDADNLYQSAGTWIRDINYWKFWGITIRNAKQEGSTLAIRGWEISRSNNLTFEQCIAHDNGGQGFQTNQNCNEIRFINCDSYNNFDPDNPAKPGGAAAGFEVVGNLTESQADTATWGKVYFTGCRSWGNSDNGFAQAYGAKMFVDSCWAWKLGWQLFDPENPEANGDGRGFLGGMSSYPSPYRQLVFQRSIAAFNKGMGYVVNSNGYPYTGDFRFYNNISYENREYGFYGNFLTYFDSVVYHNNWAYSHASKIAWNQGDAQFSLEPGFVYTSTNNSWDAAMGITITANDFLALPADTVACDTILGAARQADGSLPDIGDYFQLKSTSFMIDVGVDVGLAYNGTAPDLGAFEFVESAPPDVPNVATGAITKLTPYTASVSVNLSYDGGGTISASGVCWSTSEDPTTADSTTVTNNQEGLWSTTMTGLLKNTTYYVRAYATNASGTSYGENVVYVTPTIVRVIDGTTFQKWNGQFIDW